MDAKEFFAYVCSLNKDCNHLWEILQEEERWAGATSARIDTVHGSGIGDPTARTFDRLSLLRSRYQEACAETMAYAMRCELVLAKLPNPVWEDVLRRRFRSRQQHVRCCAGLGL